MSRLEKIVTSETFLMVLAVAPHSETLLHPAQLLDQRIISTELELRIVNYIFVVQNG